METGESRGGANSPERFLWAGSCRAGVYGPTLLFQSGAPEVVDTEADVLGEGARVGEGVCKLCIQK